MVIVLFMECAYSIIYNFKCQVKPKGAMPLSLIVSFIYEVKVQMYLGRRKFVKFFLWGLNYCVVGGSEKFAVCMIV